MLTMTYRLNSVVKSGDKTPLSALSLRRLCRIRQFIAVTNTKQTRACDVARIAGLLTS